MLFYSPNLYSPFLSYTACSSLLSMGQFYGKLVIIYIHTVLYILCSTYCAVHTVLYILCCTYCAVHSVLYIVCCTQSAVHTVLYILCCSYCDVHSVLYIPFCTYCTYKNGSVCQTSYQTLNHGYPKTVYCIPS